MLRSVSNIVRFTNLGIYLMSIMSLYEFIDINTKNNVRNHQNVHAI